MISSGGAGAPAENLDYKKVKPPVDEASIRAALEGQGYLVPEEKDFADAILEIVDTYGKFNDDNTGVWVGYTPASENEDNAKIGVKCGSCVFFNAPNGCQIIESAVEDGGLCRLAVLPDGAVTAAAEDACPPATQDIELNLKNRQNAIDNVGYGPLNPAEPNEEFWQDKADKWKTDIEEAKSAVCGNCIFFVRTPKMLDCIENGIGLGSQEAEGSIEAGELGYCNALDFKCASERTCNAWAAGGPVTEDSMQAAAGPCWDGYKQVGMKEKNGKMVPNCVPEAMAAGGYNVGDDINVEVGDFFPKPVYELPEGLKDYADEAEEDYEYDFDVADLIPTQRTVNMRRVEDVIDSDKPIKVWIDEDGEPEIIDGHHRSVAYRVNGDQKIRAKVYETLGFVATAGSKPAPKKDRIKGSKKNAIGSASGSKKINFSKKVEDSLKTKVKEHNEKSDRKATLGMLKAVYRRGAGAFSSSHRPDQNRNSWAMARVNAFLYLLKSGKPRNPAYTTDYDLLPASHPKSTKSSNSIVASANEYDDVLTVTLKNEEDYLTKEHALLALAEYSGLGYEIIPALRTSWLRAVASGENPFERATILASALYESKDADLLPKEGTL